MMCGACVQSLFNWFASEPCKAAVVRSEALQLVWRSLRWFMQEAAWQTTYLGHFKALPGELAADACQ